MLDSSSSSGSVYRAFISYSHADRAWCDWLHKALETYRVPRRLVGRETAAGVIPRRLHPIFRDRDELPSATDLNKRVEQALRDSEWLIVICSPQSASSRWVNEEVLTFKRMGRADRILCLIVAGEPNAADSPGREAQECFCAALRHQVDAGGALTAERTEPIAADARTGKDGKANAKLKLIAGMLHVGFDALKQRELQRRNRRMAAITAVALVVMAVTTVLAITAVFARNAARVAQQAAERRQKQAEDLVAFMLGDLNDKLEQESRLDLMQAVNDKAMAYFNSLPATDVSDTALAQRAKALEKIGEVRLDEGHLPEALTSFRASTAISFRLVQAAPSSVVRQVAYSRTMAYMGMTHWEQGGLDAAEHDFESARQVLKHSQVDAASDPSLMYQIAILDNDLGHVQEARGQPDLADAAYRDMLVLTRKLVSLRPDKTDYASELGSAHNNLGKLALQRGELAAAIAEYRADDAIETRLSERDPKNHDQLENKMRVRAILGRTLALVGDSRTAMQDLQEAVDIADEQVRFDPKATESQEHLALYCSQLARLQRLAGNQAAAQALSARSLEIFARLTAKDASNSGWQSEYAAARTEQAAETVAANPTEARAQAQAALAVLEPLRAKQPDSRDLVLATAGAKMVLAEVTADPQASASLRGDALKMIQAQTAGRGDPRLLALQIEALLALGRQAEAAPLLQQLWKSGYRDPALLVALRSRHIDFPANPAFSQRLAKTMRTTDADTAKPKRTAGRGSSL